MKQSSRAVAVAKLLLNSHNSDLSYSGYTALGDIATELGVSTKTISREVMALEELLADNDVQLIRKAGAGMKLEGSEEAIQKLAQTIQKMSVEENAYTPEERRSIIISKLLPSQEPIKLFVLSSMLKVTDSTISTDLDKLEDWFKQQNLKLIRKPGVGVCVEGDERSLRKAIIKYIYDNVDEKRLLSLVDENLTAADKGNKAKNSEAGGNAMKHLLNLVDQQIIKRLEHLVQSAEAELSSGLSDQAFVGLVVHLSLAVQRIRKSEAIEIDSALLNDLRQRREYGVAVVLAKKIQDEFEIEVPDDEIGYITMHLLGARNSYRKDNASVSVMDKFHLVRLAKSIMTIAEQETGKKLSRSTSLLAGLVNHLGPSISRLKMGMDIRNPLLTEMQTTYPDLMSLSRKCVVRLEKSIGKEMPDSEIAYIAMHLGAAMLEGETSKKRDFNVVVACPTGMGTSRLLAGRIKKSFGGLKIVDIVSIFKLNDEYLLDNNVDLVIATVPVENVTVPAVVVSSLLNDDDINAIRSYLKQLSVVQNGKQKNENSATQGAGFVQALEQMKEYSQAILQLLNNFFFAEIEGETDVQAICSKAAALVAEDEETRHGIVQGLLDREAKGSTLIHGTNMVLLHCASPYTKSLRFGVIHLKEGFYYSGLDTVGAVEGKGELLRTVMVMLAPQDASQLFRNTIGHISSVLMDRWGLIGILHEGDRESILEELTLVFKEFYQSKYEELLK